MSQELETIKSISKITNQVMKTGNPLSTVIPSQHNRIAFRWLAQQEVEFTAVGGETLTSLEIR